MDTSDELDEMMAKTKKLVDDWQKTLRQLDQVLAVMVALAIITIGFSVIIMEMHR